ncbi:ComF family protein [Streptomyces griseoincarnatus]|uniref:ComF family protein n=1 Tax=Streptomyces sp. Z38 TaxID=2682780 RepID=UPI0012EA3CC4|nr:ComF family protein [Streptomyces sp. Z38]MUT91890.1 ComF family protein [Streptomyces sp. Z38]
MRSCWRDLTDLVLPAECGGCARPRAVLCDRCRAALSGRTPRRVRPAPEPRGLPPVHAAAPYADEVRAVLLAHKERGALALARPLGEALAGAVRAGLGAPAARGRPDSRDGAGRAACAPVLLVPVPSARRAVRARGHDPARRIAYAAAGELRRSGVPAAVLAALGQRRPVADQSGLGSRQRLANVAGALGVAPGCARLLNRGRVVLVDDLMTTGATLAEAARAVRSAQGLPGPETEPAGKGWEASSNSRPAFVYLGETWEGSEQRRTPPPASSGADQQPGGTVKEAGGKSAGGTPGVVCAAVVAASPDAFGIHRN